MNLEAFPLKDEDPVASAAVDWFLRIQQGDASIETLTAWQQWLEQSAEHRVAYEEIQKTWSKLDSVTALPWPQPEEMERDAYDGMIAVHRHRTPGGANRQVATPVPSATPRRRAVAKPETRRQWPVWAAAACLVAAVTFALYEFNTSSVRYHSGISTGIAEHREIRLPDDSSIVVGARSEIAVEFSANRRQIRLISGEAFFSVAKDRSRPFVVDAGMGQVTAVGTAFNVRRYGNAVAVEVAEGLVRLEAKANKGKADTDLITSTTASLAQGQEALLDASGALQTVRRLPAERVAAWRQGQHHYIDEPLSIVIADLNRYTAQPIVVDAPQLNALRVTTTFFGDDWEGWLETLQTAAPGLQVRREKDAIYIFASTAADSH